MRATPRPQAPLPWLLTALLAACSSSSGAPDAATTDAATTDAAATDAPRAGDAPAAADAPLTVDAPPAGDGGACADFSGGYTLTGTCSVPGFSPFPSACITQTGCAAQVTLDGVPVPGMASGNRLTFMTSVSGIPLTCTATRNADATLAVRCEAGSAASCDAVAAPSTFPGATRWCCNIAAQDCGAGQRCNIVGVGTNNATPMTACIPAGTTAADGACTRTDGRLGTDTCAAGLTCSNYGQATAASRTCGRVCGAAADCEVGEFCIIVSSTPRAGVCRPVCILSDSSGCAVGTCRYVTAARPGGGDPVRVATCQPVGSAAEGMPCATNLDCAANLACARRNASDAFTCRPNCDASRPCAAGTCTGMATEDNPLAAGVCFP
ncbi:MAG: hypothetical protein U0325_00705 [Polyangiales bacterium]